jgi:hypothetical protein
MLLAPNRRRTRRRTSSVKRGIFSKDYCSHVKLDGWKNVRGSRPEAGSKLSENQCLGFLHRLQGYILAWVAAGTDHGHGDASSDLNAISRFKRRRASTQRSNGKFFPTISDDSTGFEDLRVVSGSHDRKYNPEPIKLT